MKLVDHKRYKTPGHEGVEGSGGKRPLFFYS
jgi:hypothetical protein